jgi:hypothetical protein
LVRASQSSARPRKERARAALGAELPSPAAAPTSGNDGALETTHPDTLRPSLAATAPSAQCIPPPTCSLPFLSALVSGRRHRGASSASGGGRCHSKAKGVVGLKWRRPLQRAEGVAGPEDPVGAGGQEDLVGAGGGCRRQDRAPFPFHLPATSARRHCHRANSEQIL